MAIDKQDRVNMAQDRVNRILDTRAATLRHVSTLAAGTIVIMAGFLAQESVATVRWPGVLAVAFVAMLASILCLTAAQFHIHGASVFCTDELDSDSVETAMVHAVWADRCIWIGVSSFFIGLLGVAAFGVTILFQCAC